MRLDMCIGRKTYHFEGARRMDEVKGRIITSETFVEVVDLELDIFMVQMPGRHEMTPNELNMRKLLRHFINPF